MKLDWIKIGDRIKVRHPVQGELSVYVMGQVLFQELWQTRSQGPWEPTGSVFPGFWLETNLFLLNWQNRFYLLEESVQLSDAEINRDFMPHARKFGQSGQSADVYFAYPPGMWHLDDIGRFTVSQISGEGFSQRTGEQGRFIHASGDGGRALVVEDYRGGGGQDTAWIGYVIEEQDIIK